MGRVRITRENGQAYLKLPDDFAVAAELDIFPLREGFYVIAPAPISSAGSKGTQQTPGSLKLSEAEGVFLKKLLGVKFEKRTPKNLDRLLRPEERELLTGILKKGLINIFKSNKYPDGVYNIKDSVYPLLKDSTDAQKEEAKNEVADKPRPEIKPGTARPDMKGALAGGYTILSDQKQAYLFSQELKASGRDRDVICFKAFDGRFYTVTKKYFSANEENVRSALKNESNAMAIAKLCNIEPDGCRAVLNVLADRGEVIEKRKDTFVLV